MRVALMQAPNGLAPDGPAWDRLAEAIRAARPDLLVTNEMPFGAWVAEAGAYDPAAAARTMAAHDAGLEVLRALGVPVVLSSRPVPAGGDRLANEAFVLAGGACRPAHHKHYFPAESGFHEDAWFRPTRPGFDVAEVGGTKAGFLLCTELFFNEWARHYRKQGAALIAVPRASGEAMARWRTAAAMAAIVSGCYVVSSNRAGHAPGGQVFGGRGFALAPDGSLIAETSADEPVVAFELDPALSAEQQRQYPCYVPELATAPAL